MGSIDYLNPPGLVKPMGYSHAVVVPEKGRTIYIGGQNAVDETGALVGKGDLRKQTEKALSNIGTILAAAGAGPDNIVKMNVYLRQGLNPAEGFQAFRQWWDDRRQLPAVTVLFVAGLGNPEWLVEIDGIAVVT